MNNNTIESTAVTKLKDALVRTCRVTPNIPENNTIPSWDGELYVYGSESFSKDNLLGRVPVQVKGTCVTRYTSSFSVSTEDLRNYQNDGGVMFYVVKLKNFDNYRIYYAPLLPFDLSRYLKSANDHASISIRMDELDMRDPDGTYQTLVEFIENKRRHIQLPGITSTVDLYSSNIPVKGLMATIPRIDVSRENPFTQLLGKDIYIYAKLQGDLTCVVDKIRPGSISQKVDSVLKIDGEPVPCKVSIGAKIGEINTLQLGEGICIEHHGKTSRLIYHAPDSLKDQLMAMYIINSFLEKKPIFLDDHEFVYGDFALDGAGAVEEFRSRFHYLQDIQQMFDLLHVKKDLIFSTLRENDDFKLELLIDGMVHHKPVPLNPGTDYSFGVISIGNISVLICLTPSSTPGQYEVRDINELSDTTIALKGAPIEKQVPASVYVMMSCQHMAQIDNLDLECVRKSIRRYPLTEFYEGGINYFALELLKYYDSRETKDCDILDTVKDILSYVSETHPHRTDDVSIQLNLLQTEKRRRKLNDLENRYLLSLKSKNKDIQVKIGASILLESYTEAELFYESLDPEQREQFSECPIMNLWPSHESVIGSACGFSE